MKNFIKFFCCYLSLLCSGISEINWKEELLDNVFQNAENNLIISVMLNEQDTLESGFSFERMLGSFLFLHYMNEDKKSFTSDQLARRDHIAAKIAFLLDEKVFREYDKSKDLALLNRFEMDKSVTNWRFDPDEITPKDFFLKTFPMVSLNQVLKKECSLITEEQKKKFRTRYSKYLSE